MRSVRQQIVEVLRGREAATVQELAEAVGVSAMSVRYHLQGLEAEGVVARAGQARLGRVGRPRHLYALALQGRTAAHLDYRSFLAAILDEARAHLGEEAFRPWLVEAAARRAAALAENLADAPLEQRLREVAASLSRQGHLAQGYEDEKGPVLHCYNCPYHPLPQAYPALCEMDAAFISGLLGRPVVQTESIPHLDGRCTFRLAEAPESVPSRPGGT
ncbi:MAG: helix-turn-helix transcriptional regulator [Anaerolineae bacterium]